MSNWTLSFRLLGIPVKVHPGFWLLVILLGSAGEPNAQTLAAWVLAVFVSILIHEFGHGIMAKFFGAKPSIELHTMGGLTSHRPLKGWWPDVLVIAAGPAAGFAFIALVFLGLSLHGVPVDAKGGFPFVTWQQFEDPLANLFIYYLCFVNIGWGLLNLVPVMPLDGGQLTRRVIQIGSTKPWTEMLAHGISIVTAAAMAGAAYYYFGSLYATILFGYFAFINVGDFNEARRRTFSPDGED